MWRSPASRRILPLLRRTAPTPSSLYPPLRFFVDQHITPSSSSPSSYSSSSSSSSAAAASLISQRWFSAAVQQAVEEVKVVVDVSEDNGKLEGADDDLGIATGVELQELLAERQGKKLFDLEPPRGPFGTKESPAIIQSLYDERIVGCSGGVGEDEHDVVWFKLKKGERYECPVCSQVFELEVVGHGGPPGGHH